MTGTSNWDLLFRDLPGTEAGTPRSVTLSDWPEAQVECEVSAADRYGCRIQTLKVAPLTAAAWNLKDWQAQGQEICRRVSYLLEPLSPLEWDQDAGVLQIRSAPPERVGRRIRYYDASLTQTGKFELQRREGQPGSPERKTIDIAATPDLLEKLLRDLTEAVTRRKAA